MTTLGDHHRNTNPELGEQCMEYFEYLKSAGASYESLREFGRMLHHIGQTIDESGTEIKKNLGRIYECFEIFDYFQPRDDEKSETKIDKFIIREPPSDPLRQLGSALGCLDEQRKSIETAMERFEEWEKSSGGGEH